MLIATSTPTPHAAIDHGHWWREYRVRPLTDDERADRYVWDACHGAQYALDVRYCCDADECAAHDGIWRVMEYGQTADQAVERFIGDDAFRRAQSCHTSHERARVAWERRRRLERAAEILRERTHTLSTWPTYAWQEIDVDADERERAEAQYAAELKRARLYTAAGKGTAPTDKIDAIKATVKAAYLASLAERRRRHQAMIIKYQQLTGV